MEYALVDNTSDRLWNTSGIGLYGGCHMWEALYVDDTFLARPGTYDWLLYGETPPVPEDQKKKHKFPWYIKNKVFRCKR